MSLKNKTSCQYIITRTGRSPKYECLIVGNGKPKNIKNNLGVVAQTPVMGNAT